MAALSKLPPELIREICLHIHEHDLDQPDNLQDWDTPQKALASLCKVSKAFCNAAQPILFRRVHITVRQQYFIPHNTKLIALLRVLIKRPYLGEQIRLLKLSVYKAGNTWINRFNPIKPVEFIPLAEDDFQLFTNAAKRESWMGDLSALWDNSFVSEEQVLLQLSLAKMPCLNEMQLAISYETISMSMFSHGFRQAVAENKILKQLRAVHMHGFPNPSHPEMRYTVMRELQPLLFLLQPQVTKLHIENCLGHWEPIAWPEFAQLAHVKHLTLHNCELTRWDFDIFVTACHSLESIAYTAHPIGSPTRDQESPETYVGALQQHSRTIKDLHLVVNPKKQNEMWKAGYSSFESFESLESLTISPSDFGETFIVPGTLGPKALSQTLPKSLKHLTVKRWCWPMRIDIDWLAQAACRGELENLETLDIEYCLSATKDPIFMANNLRAELERSTGGAITFFICLRKLGNSHKDALW
ncbi:hypothetical protein Brms1b_010097 [Colletotrichum noveboracense]|nr:hypothetical protein COL940_009023 [Colletotrichum noveboracense]KAJ0275490.1 hypothetical protein CBS470a_011275 [Colletotrichum nupharicola]KAJ0307206.1 hypothetical protein Brms1b_010097 [Colletotrichum noveboracense]